MKKRKNFRITNKKIMLSLLVFVLVGISVMTIAYATLSTTLKISGSAEFEDANWNLVLEEYNDLPFDEEIINGKIDGNLVTIGNGKLIQEPTIIGTSINDYKVSIGKIGDGVYLEYLLKNEGDVPALLESVTWTEPVVSSSTDDQSDIELVEEYFDPYPYIYSTTIEDGYYYPNGYAWEGAILCPGAVFDVQIHNYFSSQAPRVPYSKITVSGLSVNFNFVATDQNLCNGSTPVTPDDENNG